MSKDEAMRPETTFEGLSQLRPVFRKDGTITAGNACGIVDGAAAVIVTKSATAEKLGLKPLSRVVSWAVVGVPPEIMGIGPVSAIPLALEKLRFEFQANGFDRDQRSLCCSVFGVRTRVEIGSGKK